MPISIENQGTNNRLGNKKCLHKKQKILYPNLLSIIACRAKFLSLSYKFKVEVIYVVKQDTYQN